MSNQETKREQAIRQGYSALNLLGNEDFKIFMDSVRVEAWRDFSTSEPADKEKREDAYHLLRAVDKLRSNLETLAANAKYEENLAQRDEEANRQNTQFANQQPFKGED